MEEHCYIPVADADLQIKGGPGHPDPEIRGAWFEKKFFSALWASVWFKNKGGGVGGPPGPSPGSATVFTLSLI